MKNLGKRILSMTLALGISASMLLSDLSTMQVYATGNNTVVEESAESVVEEMTGENIPQESTAEEENVQGGTTDVNEPESTIVESLEESVEEETEELEVRATEEIPAEETAEEESTEIVVSQEEPTEETMVADENVTMAGVASGFILGVDDNGVLTVEFEEGVSKIFGNIEIPKEVVTIPKSAALFYGNYDVKSVTFEKGSLLSCIEDEAFWSSRITEIRIPENVKYIGSRAFASTALKKVVLETSETGIELGDMAFSANSYLNTFVTNARLRSIGDSAFLGNSVLKSFVKNTAYDNGALEGVTAIGASAFAGCAALEYMKIPNTVRVIETGTFKDCITLGKSERVYYTGARAVEIGTGVKEIKDSAFEGCNGLTQIVLRESVAKIGASVFDGCTALTDIEVHNQDGADKTEACAVDLTYTSFPHKKGLVLKSYNGTIKDWVGTHSVYGVKFTSLYKNYTISCSSEIKNGTIKPNVASAKLGTKVELTITPKTGYVLDRNSLYYEGVNGQDGNVIDAWNPTFIMPDYDVKIYGAFRELKKDEYGAKLTLTQDNIVGVSDEEITFDKNKLILSFPKAWQKAQIRVTGQTGMMPGYNELAFKSSNEKIATIDAKGNIRTVAPGETVITAQLLNKDLEVEALTLTVKVGTNAYVNSMDLSYSDTKANIAYASAEDEYDVISFPASLLSLGAQSINVNISGFDKDGDGLDIDWTIATNDKTVAKPQAAKVVGKGTIVVPKGALGETVITIKAADGSQTPVKKQFIVRVIDDKPRLVSTEVIVDPQSDTGTVIDLVTVYESNLNLNDLTVVSKTVKNGTTKWKDASDLFRLEEKEDKVYLQVIEDKENPFTVGEAYTYKNQYYIHGTLSESGEDFYLVIPSITVIKKDISTPMSISGKINIFYNGLATEKQLGTVKVKQKNKDTGLTIRDCELVGYKKTNGVNEEDDDAFSENFTAQVDRDKQLITIVRTPGDEALSCYTKGESKNKPVLTGILKVWYEGYSDDYFDEIEIEIPTHTTAPSYKLDTTKITLNAAASGQEFAVAFLKTQVQKDEDPKLDLTENTVLKLDQTENGTTPGLVETSADGTLTFDEASNRIPITIDQVKKGKIVIRLLQAEWEDQSMWNTKSVMKKTITVSVTTKAPTVKLGKNTLTVNTVCPDAVDYTTMKLNQTDSVLAEVQRFTPVDADKSENLDVVYNSEDGTITAMITGEGVKAGQHKFECVPRYQYVMKDGLSFPRSTKKIIVTVKVKNTEPSIKLKKSEFTVNANAYKKADRKYDFMTQKFTWENLPKEYSGYTLSTENMEVVYTGKGVDPLDGKNRICLDIDAIEKTATVYLESNSKVVGKGSYNIKGVELVSEESNSVIKVKPFKIKVNSINKAPLITVKAKGTINPLNPESKIEYTPTLSNISGTITDVVIREFDENEYSLVPVGEEHFEAMQDPKTGKTILTVKEDAKLEKRPYKIQLYYELSNGEEGEGWLASEGLYQVAKDQKISLSQTMPTLSLDKQEATFLAGNKERTQIITITKKTVKTAEIVDVKFSDKTPKKLQNAFEIVGFDTETGQMELKLKNSAFIAQNVEQILSFEIVCEGQLANTKGRSFDIKVNVLK